MTDDAEREAQIRAAYTEVLFGNHHSVSVLLRRLDEERAHAPPGKIAELGVTINELRTEVAQLDQEIRRLRDAIVSARWRLAKGRALWNGPCHECDAALERGLTGADIRESASRLELAALDAPPEADVMARVRGIIYVAFNGEHRRLVLLPEAEAAVARAMAEYGDTRGAHDRGFS